jgi:co-chaperonin GroES (HSP10)
MENRERWSPTDEERSTLFPDVEPGLDPFGSRVIVQIKVPRKVLGKGIILPETVREVRRDGTQIALIRGMGPLAFHDRKTLEPWPEGQWCKPGDVVLVPRFGQCERWQVPLKDESGDTEMIEFRLYDDVAILGRLKINPSTTDTNWG